jgi:hypothetical protein
MKKQHVIISLLWVLSIFLIPTRQGEAQSIPHLGILAGANFSTVTHINSPYSKNVNQRTGFIGGIYGRFMISKQHLSIQPELLYSQKGTRYQVSGQYYNQPQPVTEVLNVNYIEVPVLFAYSFIPHALLHPSIYLGPYVELKLYSKEKAVSSSGRVLSSSQMGSTVRNVDTGFSTGASLHFSRYSLGFRYTFGITRIFRGKIGDPKTNTMFSIIAGVNI